MLSHVLVARMDSVGDVLLSGPLVRAVAADAGTVSYLCSPAGATAARILPGIDQVLVGRAPWIEVNPPPLDRADTERFIERIEGQRIDEAVILTSFHQSPLPLALLLRMAGVGRVGAVSVDYPGSLLDVRHQVDDDIHEVERSLSLGRAMGYALPVGDDGSLRVQVSPTAAASVDAAVPSDPFIVVHPGASVPARAWRPDRHAALVDRLSAAGWPVVVTGGRSEQALTALVSGTRGIDMGGRLDLSELAVVIGRAVAVVAGNTGPAHLAAAVATPVVSVFAPTVPALRWRPWMVPHRLLGHQEISCAGCRARVCPVPGHPCIDDVDVSAVLAAIDDLTAVGGRVTAGASRARGRGR